MMFVNVAFNAVTGGLCSSRRLPQILSVAPCHGLLVASIVTGKLDWREVVETRD